jgi:RHS repeat-associated protein
MTPARPAPARKQVVATWKMLLLSDVLPEVDTDGGRKLRWGEGEIYFNARYYDPTTGRFLSEDPSRKGHSWYSYCNNNPLTYTDPTGRKYESLASAELTGNQPAAEQRGRELNWRDYAGRQAQQPAYSYGAQGELITNGAESALTKSATTPGIPTDPNATYYQAELNLVGSKYIWGGKNPVIDKGLDCSGAAEYGLKQVPGVPKNLPVMNANSLFEYTVPVVGEPRPGDLRFRQNAEGEYIHIQTIGVGGRINPSGGPLSDIDNPGIIEFKSGPTPASGVIRRWDWDRLFGLK